MTEHFFQFIWQHSLYNSIDLKTIDGDAVVVKFAGKYNTDAGPDFEEAKVKIGSTLLVGNVELHLKTSDWFRHNHHRNKAYENVILHVVMHHDINENLQEHVPILSLEKHIPDYIVTNYEALSNAPQKTPCQNHIAFVSDITKEAWLSRLLAERWEQKFEVWDKILQQHNGDWRQLLYLQMAANFGFKTNATPFMSLAQSLPINILARHHNDLFQIQALLFGQAGMLQDNFKDDFPFRLRKEYEYLAKKYSLTPIKGHVWKFMRMRPANFPSIRIAQFAVLIHRSFHLFSQIVSSTSLKDLEQLLAVSASDYWDTHYNFDSEESVESEKNLGINSIHNIIINTIAPIRHLYSMRVGISNQYEQSIALLEQIAPERNTIIQFWEALKWQAKNAAQSQAQIQLYNQYCSSKKCLQCSIGNRIIRLRP